MEEIAVRQYRKDDRAFVRDIAWDTAFIGRPAAEFFDGKDILAGFLTQYFTDYEPESCFVALSEGTVIGYLLGSKNTAALGRVFKVKILPRLLMRAIVCGTWLNKKNFIFLFNFLISVLRGEFKMPDFSREYPATLHINLKSGFRGQKIGSRLISAYMDYLRRQDVRGVCLATMSPRAGNFFQEQGFNLLFSGRRSYFRYILEQDVPLYIYGRKLP